MNFRLVWVGSDDEGEGNSQAQASAAALQHQRCGAAGYEIRGTEMVRREQLASGRWKVIPIANFTARITGDLIVDDDAGPRREFAVEAQVGGQRLCFAVPAAEFGRMGWVLNQLGPKAILYPGQHQHARAAIQRLSGAISEERIFTHMGWRRHGQEWVYLQSGGALGAPGLLGDVRVQLPAALVRYRVQPAADRDGRISAIRASLDFLSVAPDRISIPLLAAVYRAPLGKTNFSMFLAGSSGVFKTALAALCQQHFGAEMDAKALPAHFASTANSLEELAFAVKDALLVVDDFVPATGDNGIRGTAARLFRAAGNQQSRGRMSGTGQPGAPRPPRALVLATGEEVPRGGSLRARLLIIELRRGEVDRTVLSQCQSAARQGQFAVSMAAYLSWIAQRYEEVQQRLKARVRELQSQPPEGTVHARLPAALAELESGWEIWLQFASEAGAIDIEEQAGLAYRASKALAALGALQAPYQTASDSALQFVTLLGSALAGGRAHVTDRSGGVPEGESRWGWKRQAGGKKKCTGCGARIGWVSGSDLYLDSSASFETARQETGAERFVVSEQTLRRRLHERGLLASIDPGRQTLLVRRTLEGTPRHVLHLKVGALMKAI